MVELLPLRLHCAISLIFRSNDPGAVDVQSASGEVTARIVILEEALRALLAGPEDSLEQARRAMAFDGS